MKFHSTNNHERLVSFEDALFEGLPPDYGLYTIPKENIPILSLNEIENMRGKSYQEIAFPVLYPFLNDEMSENELREILKSAYSKIEVPLQKVEKKNILWMTKGPTYSFKDFAARFLGQTLDFFLKKRKEKRMVLVATSGDTGGAVADALKNLENVSCVILFPKGAVSESQRRQMTTLGDKVLAIEVEGDFDTCQSLVKRILSDRVFASENFCVHDFITSANSISLGRLLPQIVFPFYAYAHCERNFGEKIVCSIPSGNFGDMMGTTIAKAMGLPIEKIICGVNENKTFPNFLESEKYSVSPTVWSPSTAMMISHPSNVARLFDLYGGNIRDIRENGSVIKSGAIEKMPNMKELRNDIFSASISNDTNYKTIKEVYKDHKIILEPHGAVAWQALIEYEKTQTQNLLSIIYETADPAKFSEDVEKALGFSPQIPDGIIKQSILLEKMTSINSEPKNSKTLGRTASDEQYGELKNILLSLAM